MPKNCNDVLKCSFQFLQFTEEGLVPKYLKTSKDLLNRVIFFLLKDIKCFHYHFSLTSQ